MDAGSQRRAACSVMVITFRSDSKRGYEPSCSQLVGESSTRNRDWVALSTAACLSIGGPPCTSTVLDAPSDVSVISRFTSPETLAAKAMGGYIGACKFTMFNCSLDSWPTIELQAHTKPTSPKIARFISMSIENPLESCHEFHSGRVTANPEVTTT
jgi:hypothetical protein